MEMRYIRGGHSNDAVSITEVMAARIADNYAGECMYV